MGNPPPNEQCVISTHTKNGCTLVVPWRYNHPWLRLYHILLKNEKGQTFAKCPAEMSRKNNKLSVRLVFAFFLKKEIA